MSEKFKGLANYILWTEKENEILGLRGWKVKWMERNSLRKCGTCDCRRKTIFLNHDYFYLTEDHSVLLNTVRHEQAHALDFERNGVTDHSPRWKAIARSIGCDGERCNAEAVMPTRRNIGLSFAVPSFSVE